MAPQVHRIKPPMIEEFISKEEQKEIIKWVENILSQIKDPKEHYSFINKDPESWVKANGKYYRYCKLKNLLPIYPNDLILKIKQRIIDRYTLHNVSIEPKFEDFVSILYPQGKLNDHKDYHNVDLENGQKHLRFNLLIQLPSKGGRNRYNNNILDVKERMLLEYRPDLHYHGVTLNEGKKERINLSFGFLENAREDQNPQNEDIRRNNKIEWMVKNGFIKRSEKYNGNR